MTSVKRPFRTKHQRDIMGILLRELSLGRVLTQREVYDLLPYKSEVTYGAMRVSVRLLEENEMLKREMTNNRVGRVFVTEKGYDWFRPKA